MVEREVKCNCPTFFNFIHANVRKLWNQSISNFSFKRFAFFDFVQSLEWGIQWKVHNMRVYCCILDFKIKEATNGMGPFVSTKISYTFHFMTSLLSSLWWCTIGFCSWHMFMLTSIVSHGYMGLCHEWTHMNLNEHRKIQCICDVWTWA